jgi:hypothetical protein
MIVILERPRFPVTILTGTVIFTLTSISVFGKELNVLCRFLQEIIFRKTTNLERIPPVNVVRISIRQGSVEFNTPRFKLLFFNFPEFLEIGRN